MNVTVVIALCKNQKCYYVFKIKKYLKSRIEVVTASNVLSEG